MSDSPAVRAPLDPKEQPILDSVLYLRDQLSLLKQDRSTYIKSHDVLLLYEQVIEQVHLLNVIRAEHDKPLEQNRGPHVPLCRVNWEAVSSTQLPGLTPGTQWIMCSTIASNSFPYSF